MDANTPLLSESFSQPEFARHFSPQTWAIVLAGGDGVRLRRLVRGLFGDERPKQFVPLLGPASLLRQTLDRVARLVPPERTVVVGRTDHVSYIARELAERPGPRVLLQPQDRGTGTAVLFAAHWIRQWDPEATVAVFPSDHYILEEDLFAAHVREVLAYVGRHPWRLVLLGAPPTRPEQGYGWIQPTELLDQTVAGPVFGVGGFLEKPDQERARWCLAKGWLWNTFVFATTLPALLDIGRDCLPSVDGRLKHIAAFTKTPHEAWAIRQAYALAPACDFSRAVLQQCPPGLAVSPLPRLTWCDLGTPARVVGVVKGLSVRPTWMSGRRTIKALGSVLEGAQQAL
jgi:mannose-1-phosphate guanylyltransferase